ncbi:hypothetical protein LZ009_02485 [Ramlibacter sp. XY19]|uniref:hypothetical protein n=1 Tax=Ramlibacter paludis TaxID=2908000 RepID=UPI0023D99F64|nr:hypothetical protein [Ramlibacter paludis]MCG2591641.1 hypothetical protein [Ramlibacter paludis]
MDTLRTLINRQLAPHEWVQVVWATVALAVLCAMDQATRGPSLTALIIQNYFN